MALAITSTATTETSWTIGFSGAVGSPASYDVQISPRRGFQFCVAPIYNIATGSSYEFKGLNQRANLYARARARYSDGSVDAVWTPIVGARTADGTAQVTTPATVMISPAIVVTPERALSISSTSTVAGFPEDNLFRDSPVGWKAKVVTSPVQTSAFVSIDFTMSGQPIDIVALLNTNLPEATTIYIQAANSLSDLNGQTGTFVQPYVGAFRASANLPGRNGYHGLFTFSAVQRTYWRIFLAAIKTADTTYVEHLIVGRNRVTKNHSVDKTETPITKTTIDRTRSGLADRVQGLPMRKVEFEISMLTEQQYEAAYGDLSQYENEAVLVVPNAKSGAFFHDRILYGDMKGSRVFNPSSPRYTRGFSIESLI
jgi:hypothetical protein